LRPGNAGYPLAGEHLKLSQFRAAEHARFEPVRGRPQHAFQVAAGFKITVKVLFAFSLVHRADLV
jgi:hypothetical protein